MLQSSMLYPQDSAIRRSVRLDGMWKFQLDPQACGTKEGWIDGLPSPDLIPVPASFADFYTDKETREFCGDFWYETEFYIPDEWKGKEVDIRFGSVTHRANVYFNGIEVTSHEGGFLPFCARVTEIARYGSLNKLVVLANNELSETTLPCGSVTTLPSGRKVAKPYFDFYNYAGIQRSVWLTATPKESIFDFSVVHAIDGTDALVTYDVVTNGENKVAVEVKDEAGNIVAEAEGKSGEIRIPNVRLWKVLDAYLYKFTIRIVDGDAVIDEYAQDIGVRTVAIRNNQILINDEPVYLKGFGKHEDSDIVGRGFNIGAMKRDFELMKWVGANSFRTSHYPYSEEIYQMADREGFLITDEVPAVGMFPSLMNFAEASTGKQTAFFAQDTTPELLKNHLIQVEEMIARDKNHACVFAWSLLNEPDTLDESSTVYFEKVFDRCGELDPQKRPRTFSLLMNSTPDKCKCWQLSDFLSLNRYFGWYVMGGADIESAEMMFRKEMDAWAELVGERPMIFTEYGGDTNGGIDKLPSVMWSQEYQIECLEMCHRVFDSYPFVKGEQIWNFADFQTTEGIMRMDGNKKGIFTRQRQPKRAAYYIKQRWENLSNDYKTE